MATVRLEQLSKIYAAGVRAVDRVSFTVQDGEFVVLVGPSGCGKSTTLRMIAGLEDISDGNLFIGESRVNEVPPKDRDIAMVFQNYALYPHMTVFDNMAFGLKLRHFSKAEIKQRVAEAARIVDLQDLLERKPKALSGGQRQRVAVGRAIVRHPKVFLFDEPLSNLDAKLRVQMRFEIAKLHRELKATMIYVTHDQVEAMTMADRIVVMNKGLVQQFDTPLNLYNHPVNKFVAGFIGSPSMNFVAGRINEAGIFTDATQQLSIALLNRQLKNINTIVGIRPEDIYAKKTTDDARYQPFEAFIEMIEPMGNETFLHFHLDNTKMVARVAPETAPKSGEQVLLYLDSAKLHFFDAETEAVLYQ